MEAPVRQRVELGAYQFLDIDRADLGEQYTESGRRPRTVIAKLTTAMDEHFVNRTVTALLTEEAQVRIINAFMENLEIVSEDPRHETAIEVAERILCIGDDQGMWPGDPEKLARLVLRAAGREVPS